jgi:hypothetical protein
MGRMKEIALELEDFSYGALREMLDMGGALTPLIKQELERRDNARKDAMDRREPDSIEDHYTGA